MPRRLFGFLGGKDTEVKKEPVEEPIPDVYVEGKYAVENTYNQAMKAFASSEGILNLVSPELGDKANKASAYTTDNMTTMSGWKKPDTMHTGVSMWPLRLQGEPLKHVHNELSEIKEEFEKVIKNPPNENVKNMMGYFNFLSKLYEQKHNVTDAMWTNPYLENFINATTGMPRIKSETMSLDEVFTGLNDKVDEKGNVVEGPLKYLNNFFYNAGELWEREFEKQEFDKKKDSLEPMEAMLFEKEYLKKLNANFKEMLSSYDSLSNMVDDKGNSPFDMYMNNKLDQVVGKAVGGIGDRSPREQVAYMRGCQRAIDNGWGMDELGVIGHVTLMEKQVELIEKKAKAGEKITPEEQKRFEEFKMDVKDLKEKVWDVDARKMANKAAVLSEVEAFNEKYKDFDRIQKQISVKNSQNYFKIAKNEINKQLVSNQYEVNSKDLKVPEYNANNGAMIYNARKNGWPVEYLPVYNAYDKLKREVETAMENADRKFKNWEKKQFQPLKEFIENKEIKKPADVLQVIDKLDNFIVSNGKSLNTAGSDIVQNTLVPEKKNLQICWNKAVGAFLTNPGEIKNPANEKVDKLSSDYITNRRAEDSVSLKEQMKAGRERIRDDINSKADLIRNAKDEYNWQKGIEKGEDEKRVKDMTGKEVTNEKILELLKEQHYSMAPKDATKVFAKFIENKVRAGMNEFEDTEYLDAKHPDHSAYEQALRVELSAYTKKCLNPLRFNKEDGHERLSNNVIAALLEQGGHDEYVNQIKDRAAARVKFNQIRALRESEDMDKAFTNLKAAKEQGLGGKGLKDAFSALEKAEKARKELSNDIAKKEKAAMDPKTKNRNALTIPDSKKLKSFKDKQKAALDLIKTELNKYEEVLKTGQLNQNDRAAYDALLDARKKGLKLQNNAASLEKQAFNMTHVSMLRDNSYKVNDAKLSEIAKNAPKAEHKKVLDKKVDDLTLKRNSEQNQQANRNRRMSMGGR